METAPVRKKQLEFIGNILKQFPNSIVTGDFNFDSSRNFTIIEGVPLENDNLKLHLPSHQDIWPTLHPDEKGFTFDSVCNKVIHHHEQMRYDRIMFFSQAQTWKSKVIDLVGTELIGEENGKPVFPSDHFGRVAEFEFVH